MLLRMEVNALALKLTDTQKIVINKQYGHS